MDTRNAAPPDLLEGEKTAINDLVRESGVVCQGIQDGFLLFSTKVASREDLQKLVADIVGILTGDDISDLVRGVRDRTIGIRLMGS